MSQEMQQRILTLLTLQPATIQQEMQLLETDPTYPLNLILITVSNTQPSHIRAGTGLLLKNLAKRISSSNWKSNNNNNRANNNSNQKNTWDPHVLQQVKQLTLQAIGMAYTLLRDPDKLVRSTIGTIITTIATSSNHEFNQWPDLIPTMKQAILSQDENIIEGAFKTLDKILEDMELESSQTQNFDEVIPVLINAMRDAKATIRAHTLSCLLHFVSIQKFSPMFEQQFSNFLANTLGLASDTDTKVRKLVCQILTRLLDSRPNELLPYINDLINYMLQSTQDSDRDIALEACEFWITIAEVPDMTEHLAPHLPKVLPVLLAGMVYSSDDLMMLDADDGGDDQTPDKQSDIAPRHHHAKNKGSSLSIDKAKSENDMATDDLDQDDDDDDEDGEVVQWNLRKCSAAGLDVLCTMFGPEMLPILLPIIQTKLQSDEWQVRESGILALGAIAEGCMDGIIPHLPTLMPYLLQVIDDPRPLVRSITAWTISRYVYWICGPESGEASFFVPVLQKLLVALNDRNKRVQESACSAVAVFEEEANETLEPFLEPVLQSLAQALDRYQSKNLLILYDTIVTLSESMGNLLNRPELIKIIMPPLMARWNTCVNEDNALLSMLECFTGVAAALEKGFAPYAMPIWQRCLYYSHKTLTEEMVYQQDPDKYDVPNVDILIVCLDLMSSITQGMGEAVLPLLDASYANDQPPLLQIIASAFNSTSEEIKQSTFALVGDLAISVFPVLVPHLDAIVPALIQAFDPAKKYEPPMMNNAVWALGEIALKWGPNIRNYVPSSFPFLLQHINRHGVKASRTLMENAAIAVGRIGVHCSDLIAPRLDEFIENWLKALGKSKDNEEKASAYRGLMQLITANPNGPNKCFILFLEALCYWGRPPPDLKESFTKILHAYKQMYGTSWNDLMKSVSPQVLAALQTKYSL